jgi:hypothetical protein
LPGHSVHWIALPPLLSDANCAEELLISPF